MEQKTKQIEVEMTLEEAAELFQKGYEEIASRDPCRNTASKFQREMHFRPSNLSELTRHITNNINDSGEKDYSSGRIYSIKKGKKKIEVFRPYISEFIDKKGERNLLVDTLFESKEGAIKEGCFTPSFAVYANTYIGNLAKSNDLYKEKIFELEEDGRATPKEISNLPIWDSSEDYDKFLKFVYGKEGLHPGWRIGIVNPKNINKHPKLFTTCLNTDKNYVHLMAGKSYVNYTPFYVDMPMGEKKCESGPWPKPILQRLDSKNSGGLILKGSIQIPNGHNSLESSLIQDYVQPQNIGNGVIVMNEDRIPKYLKRNLGL